jgi:hypothetical protein
MFNEAALRMEQRFLASAQQEADLLESVGRTVIIDKLVPPRLMLFVPDLSEVQGLRVAYASDLAEVTYRVHRHALGQLCAKVGLPLDYVNFLQVSTAKREAPPRGTRLALLGTNLNTLFGMTPWEAQGGQAARFLHRIVGDELRGFLSRRYNRQVASAPLLRAFSEGCRKHGARAIEATVTPVRASLKCLLPAVFEAFPGEYICIGAEWVNSDFGAGKLSVSQTVWRVGASTSTVLDESFARIHLGSVLEDGDIELSSDTAQKEVAALQGLIRDALDSLFAEKSVEHLLAAIRIASAEKVPWNKLRGQLSRFLTKTDLEWLQGALDKGDTIIDLPPVSFEADGTRVPNLYWAQAAIGAVASKTEDTDRRLDLQREAGKLLAAALGGS